MGFLSDVILETTLSLDYDNGNVDVTLTTLAKCDSKTDGHKVLLKAKWSFKL